MKLNMIRLLLFCSLAFFFLSFFRVTMNFSNNEKKKKDLFYKHNPLFAFISVFSPFFSPFLRVAKHTGMCVFVYVCT